MDIDTYVGMTKGIPKLLEVFHEHSILTSFFVVMGPDTMGKHKKRFKKKGYLKRILKVNPFKLIRNFGIKPFFYGTLLKSPSIGSGNPKVLKDIIDQGHEVGIHSYNHCRWADEVEGFSGDEIQEEYDKCCELFESIAGEPPKSSAAPNWRCNERTLEIQDKLKFLFASDVRGSYPFYPKINNKKFKTLQIPSTLPSTHECLQTGKVNKKTVIKYIVGKMNNGINVLTIHDWFEALGEIGMVEEFIKRSIDLGFKFRTLGFIAGECLKEPSEIPFSNIVQRNIEGGIGTVSCQDVR